METLSTLSDFVFSGYVVTAILLFLAYWVFPTHRQTLRRLISLSYIYLVIGSLIFLVISIHHISSYSGGNDEWEQYAFTNRLFGPYWFAHWGAILFKGIVPQILWIKKMRQSIWPSIALVPFLLISFYMPLLYSRNRDYLPSSWTMYWDFTELFLTILTFAVILTITFILTRKKNVA